jgi:hypothetical protein
VASGVLTSECKILRGATTGTSMPDGSWLPPAENMIYTGPCRVVRVARGETHPVQGERRDTTHRYSAQVLASAPEILVGDALLVTASKDANMIGRSFRVEGMIMGSEVWSRDMVVMEFEAGS